MSQSIINNNASGLSVRTSINSNFTELYNEKVNKSGDSITGSLGVSGNVTASNITSTSNIDWDGHEFVNKLPTYANLNTVTTPHLWFTNGGNSTTSVNCTEGYMFLAPIWISTNCTLSGAGIMSGTNSGAIDIDIGLYGANINGLPDSRVVYTRVTAPSGTVLAGDVLLNSFSGVTVKRGMYWAAIKSNSGTIALYQSNPSATGTNNQPVATQMHRLLPTYKGVNNGHLITTVTGGGTIPEILPSGRLLDLVTTNQASSSYRLRSTCPFVFFVPIL